MAQRQVFSTKTVYWLMTVSVLSFAGAAYFMIYGGGGAKEAARANAYSYSAIGHRAFAETLRRLDVPVLVSRDASAAKAGISSLLVVAEPRRESWVEETIETLSPAEHILLILPKWDGPASRRKAHWLDWARLLPKSYVESSLRKIVPDAEIRRPAGSVDWVPGSIGVTPDIDAPQLIESDALRPIITSEAGILVGELNRGRQRIWIVSDPDILSNHGLGRGDNAVLSLRLVDAIRPPDGAVIFDETIHGFWQPQSLWRALFEIPLVIPTILGFAAIIVLAWSATERFGAPLPARPALKPGKAALIDNTASLLRFGGYGSVVLSRYAEVTMRDVARRLNAPRKLDERALIDWLVRIGEIRGVGTNFRVLHEKAGSLAGNAGGDGARLARAARNLYRWKQEIINGS